MTTTTPRPPGSRTRVPPQAPVCQKNGPRGTTPRPKSSPSSRPPRSRVANRSRELLEHPRGRAAVIAGAGLGLLIGVLLGLLGGGGSILAVPGLVYGAGVPLAAAVPMSLLVVGLSAATALLPRLRRGQLSWRIAGVFGVAGAGAAFAGAAVNRLLDPRVVLIGFAALMVVAAVRMLHRQVPLGGDCALPGGGVNW